MKSATDCPIFMSNCSIGDYETMKTWCKKKKNKKNRRKICVGVWGKVIKMKIM